MKAFRNRFIRVTRRVSALLLALIVVLFISSCSDEGMKLCRVNLDTGSISRQLDAIVNTSEIDQDFLIYYKAIYKGTGTACGDMTTESKYKLLGTEGILLSQGIWKIDVLLTNKIANTNPASEVEKSDLTNPLEGSTGDVFVNLNTNTFRVTIGQGSGTGSIWFTYSLRNVTNYNFDLSFFALRDTFERITIDGFELTHPNTEENDKFISGSNNKQKEYSLPTGIYYAVVTITNKTTSDVIFTDSIGFVIKKDVLTKLDGHYHHNTSNSSIINVSKNPGTDSSGSLTTEDIKEWGGNEFTDGGTYKIVDDTYTFVCSEYSNRNKVLEDKDVVIDLNGKKLINIYDDNNGQNNRKSKTYFTVASGSSLKIINSVNSPSIYGFDPLSNSKFLAATLYPSFIVDSGTLSLGSNISTNDIAASETKGSITVTGCVPTSESDANTAKAPISVTEKGGVINLYGNGSGVTITETQKGIATITGSEVSNLASTNAFNLTINMSDSAINAKGEFTSKNKSFYVDNYGIYLDGFGKSGKIVINIGDANHSASITSTGAKGSYKNYGIYITNFVGEIEINISSGSTITASGGYAIYINCPNATAKINNNGSVTGNISNNEKAAQ